MSFLAPQWLAVLLSLPLIVVLYMIRSRYRREPVASLLLWRGIARHLVVHTAWRRPRWELLLILQLLVALAATTALARPGVATPAAHSLVIVLDVSSSMRATDVTRTRFDAARREVSELVRSAGDDWLALVTAGARPEVVASGGKDALNAALGSLQPEDRAGDMAAALRAATGLAAGRPGFRGQVVAVTDGAFALERGLPPESAAVSFRLVGGQSEHVAISQVSLRRPIEAGTRVSGFASAVNFGSAPITAPLVVNADGVQVDSQEVTIPPRGRTEVAFQVPSDSRAVLVGLPDTDALAADTRIELTAPAASQVSVLLVSDDPALWTRALNAASYVTWRTVRPEEYDERLGTTGGVVVFDRTAPQHLPAAPLVLVEPPTPVVTSTGDPRPARAWDVDAADPLLRGLDIAPLMATRATPIAAPEWASVAVADSDGAPLLLHGIVDGRRVVILPFDPAGSNLPQLAAFPLLVTNMLDWLTPGRGEETHAGPGAGADIGPRPESVAPVAADLPGLAAGGVSELWPFFVLAALAIVVLQWAVATRWRIGPRRPGLLVLPRAACVACLALALLQPAIKLPDDAVNVVFAVDTSNSISAEARERAAGWINSALDSRHPGDRVGTLAFAGDAHVVQAPVEQNTRVELPLTGDGGATDIGLALRVAGALARQSKSQPGRVVLLSDGRPTAGDLDAAVAEIGDVPVDVVALSELPGVARIAIERIDLPPVIWAGETFDATAVLDASQATEAILQVSVDGQATRDDIVRLAPGSNRISVSQTLVSEGFHRISARVGGPAAVESNANVAEGFVVVKPAPRVLIIEERKDESLPVQATVRDAGLRLDVHNPDQLPGQAQLESYAAVVVVNVSATSFTLDQQKTLRAYVEANGHGLVVVGGTTSYGLGSYADSVLEEALPVTSVVPPGRDDARLALLLIVDDSQSMSRKSDGVSSIEMARQAAILASRSLDDRDVIGVLAFNHHFQWLVPMGVIGQIGRELVESKIGQLEPEGGTDIFAAVSEGAAAMLATQADLRHIVLFTDGQSRPGDYDPLLARLRAKKIGLSTIGLGPEADTQLLSSLAKLGEGRYYFTERTPELPRIMTREIAISKRSAQVEGQIQPQLVSSSPILRGIAPSDIPSLAGYVATTPRDEAQVVLATEDGRPLLSQWHFGLGRSVSWTSDGDRSWAAALARWPQAGRLWEQSIRWAMGRPVQRDFQVNVTVSGHRADVTLERARDGRFADLERPAAAVVDPAGRSATAPLRQVAPGRYSASVIGDVPGTYQLTVTGQPDSAGATRSETSGFVIQADPESAAFGPDEHVLRRIASETGGRLLTTPASAFRAEGRPRGEHSEPIWQLLVLGGLVLFVVDVGARRMGWW